MSDTATINHEPEGREADRSDADGWEWAVVEVFGHRKHAGRIREEERFGAKMLRIDVPTVVATVDGSEAVSVEGWTTRWYGGGSIFSLTLTDEASVMRANRPYAAPARLTYRDPSGDEDDFDEGDDD